MIAYRVPRFFRLIKRAQKVVERKAGKHDRRFALRGALWAQVHRFYLSILKRGQMHARWVL
jgi:hypothetical protein